MPARHALECKKPEYAYHGRACVTGHTWLSQSATHEHRVTQLKRPCIDEAHKCLAFRIRRAGDYKQLLYEPEERAASCTAAAACSSGIGIDVGGAPFCNCGVCLPDDPFFGVAAPDCGSTYSNFRESNVKVTGPWAEQQKNSVSQRRVTRRTNRPPGPPPHAPRSSGGRPSSRQIARLFTQRHARRPRARNRARVGAGAGAESTAGGQQRSSSESPHTLWRAQPRPRAHPTPAAPKIAARGVAWPQTVAGAGPCAGQGAL